MFREALEEERGEAISYEDALLLWYDTVYTPAVDEIKQNGAMERFPDRTEADLFMWMWQHQQKLEKHYPAGPVHRVVAAVASFVRWPWLRLKRLI
jgi:hypothetical protein